MAPRAEFLLVSGTPQAAVRSVSVSSAGVSFLNVAVGSTVTQFVTLSSTGTEPITITAARVTGADFSVSGVRLPVTLRLGQQARLTLEFHPASAGVTSGQLSVSNNATSGGAVILQLSGKGVLPTVSGLTCESGAITGAASNACMVQVKSVPAMSAVSVKLSSSDPAVTVPAIVTIPANKTSAPFSAAVSPVSTARTVTLTASQWGTSTQFKLKLNAVVPLLSVGTTSVSFGDVVVNGQGVTRSIALSSTGTAPLRISGATVSGVGFKLLGATLPITLNPGQTSSLEVGFDPTSIAPAAGQLSITSNSSATAQVSVQLSGNGVAPSAMATVTVGSSPGLAISPTFMGLSHEWGWAQSMMGDSTVGVDKIYRQLLSNLKKYGSGPIVLRIGGNTTDHTGEPTATTALPFAELAASQGERFDLGVNLGSDDVHLAVRQATAFVNQMPPDSLDAIEIGNEPDTYSSNGIRNAQYTYQDYVADFNLWKENILPLLHPETRLMGPSWAGTGMLKNAPSYLSAESSALGVFSTHFYVANGKADNPPDILLNPKSATVGPEAVANAVSETHGAGLPFRMGEINSLYNGGGPGVSNTFQAALWSIDNMFEYANVGVDGVNWHMGEDAVYAPFAIRVKEDASITSYSLTSVNPLYYGLLFFQGATGNGAHLLATTVDTKANVKAWATVDASGTPRVAIINKDEKLTGTVNVSLSGYSHAQVYRLTAPSYESASGLTFAGQTFDGSTNGVIQGTEEIESVDVAGGVFSIPMPITSAALIVFTK